MGAKYRRGRYVNEWCVILTATIAIALVSCGGRSSTAVGSVAATPTAPVPAVVQAATYAMATVSLHRATPPAQPATPTRFPATATGLPSATARAVPTATPSPTLAPPATATSQPNPATVAHGKAIFTSVGCSLCHTIQGVSDGTQGPNLSHIASQPYGSLPNDPAFLRRWIANPPGD